MDKDNSNLTHKEKKNLLENIEVLKQELQNVLRENPDKIDDPKKKFFIFINRATVESKIASLYSELEDYAMAIKFFLIARTDFQNALPLAPTRGDKLDIEKNLAAINSSISSLYIAQNNYHIAAEFEEEAYAFWKQHMYLNELIASLQNLGIIYLNLGKIEKAVDYVLKAMQKAMQLGDELQFAYSIEILLKYYEEKEDYDMLRTLKEKALEFWKAMNIGTRIFKTAIDLGVICQMQEDYPSALSYFKMAYNKAYQLKDAESMFLAQGFIAETYFQLKDIENAKKTYYETLRLGLYINQFHDFENEVEKIAVALMALGEPKEKIEALKKDKDFYKG